MYMVVQGRARYFCLTPGGKKIVLLWIPPGETFGAAAILLNPVDYLLSTETVRDSLVLEWDGATMRRLAIRYPRLMDNLLLISFDYLTAYRALHLSQACDTAGQRVAQVLVDLAIGMGHKVPEGIELDIRNEELANAANVTPFTASRLLSTWHRSGMVVKGRGKVLLRCPEQLLLHEI
jgi:CRP-like cAMP-binding protein